MAVAATNLRYIITGITKIVQGKKSKSKKDETPIEERWFVVPRRKEIGSVTRRRRRSSTSADPPEREG